MFNPIQTQLKQDTAQIIAALNLDANTARIEVQCLLQHVLKVPRAYLIAHPERRLNEAEHKNYVSLFLRRLHGEPIAYILGEGEFFGLSLQLNSATLIPRPETELLVEKSLQIISTSCLLNYGVLDLGTGSGAIALSIAHHYPDITVVSCDNSGSALEVAQVNARRLHIKNVTFMHSDWYAALGEQGFDLIVSNPPYIAADDSHLQRGDLRFEPASALASGADGLQDMRKIITRAHAHLKARGQLWLEHGYDQAERVRDLLHQAGFTAICSERDLSGIERITGGKFID
jgi:release factor glutamine methyltransferase